MTNPWAEPYQDVREANEPLFAPGGGYIKDPKTGKVTKIEEPKPDAPDRKDGPLWDMVGDKSQVTPSSTTLNIAKPLNRYGAGQLDNPNYGTEKPKTDAFTGNASITSGSSPTKPIPANASSAATSTADKIKSGMDIYNKQKAAGDFKGATETGRNISALKYGSPEERKAKTIGTRNPLMDKTFGYQTGQAPDQLKAKADAVGPTQTVTAKSNLPGGDYSAAGTAKMSQRTRNILGTSVKRESKEIIHNFLVKEGYVMEEKAKRWWDDDGDGKGYEEGEVEGKFKRKGKKKKK